MVCSQPSSIILCNRFQLLDAGFEPVNLGVLIAEKLLDP
jgi:hypothetical protein